MWYVGQYTDERAAIELAPRYRTKMRHMDPRSDAEVVADVLGGDTEAFGALVDRYQRRVFNLTCRMVGNRSDAEDLSQEIFCKLFQNLHRFDPSLPLQNWLMRIASNHTLNWLEHRRRRTLPFEADSDLETRAGLRFTDPSPSPAERAEGIETGTLIVAALQRLPHNYRLVFVLKYMDDYTSEEVAEIVDAPRNTVKTWIFRAREALRAELEHVFPARMRVERKQQ